MGYEIESGSNAVLGYAGDSAEIMADWAKGLAQFQREVGKQGSE